MAHRRTSPPAESKHRCRLQRWRRLHLRCTKAFQPLHQHLSGVRELEIRIHGAHTTPDVYIVRTSICGTCSRRAAVGCWHVSPDWPEVTEVGTPGVHALKAKATRSDRGKDRMKPGSNSLFDEHRRRQSSPACRAFSSRWCTRRPLVSTPKVSEH